jgi:transcription-repair coupling factor (superfamily II helicase)
VVNLTDLLGMKGALSLGEVPEGYDALVLADMARAGKGVPVTHIARDDARMAEMLEALQVYAPEIEVLQFPAWDCLPYDRVSPQGEILSQRMATLARLVKRDENDSQPFILLTTINAMLQRVPPRAIVAEGAWRAHVGNVINVDELTRYFVANGFSRTGTVREHGEYAVRGGIIDVFPPGADLPIRLDMFGDTLDAIRSFDAESQRTVSQLREVELVAVSEVHLDDASISRFRTAYVKAFGTNRDNDPLYEAVKEGRKYHGMEHWLPLFYEQMDSVFDYLPDGAVCFDHNIDSALNARLELIQDYYEARVAAREMKAIDAAAYKPLKPEQLYLNEADWKGLIAERPLRSFSPFAIPDGAEGVEVHNLGVKQGRSFAPERQQPDTNLFDALGGHILGLRKAGKRIVIASWSHGARERLMGVLNDHNIPNVEAVDRWQDVLGGNKATVKLIVFGLERGFETDEMAVISEQDVLGDRLVRRHKKKRADNFITQAASLTPGDYVVHVDHGIGKFEGLQTVDVTGEPHDCLLLIYHGGDKLFLPVENIELLSRYGSEDAGVQLDRLGGSGWQARKSKMKERLREIAGQLIKIAAARELKEGVKIVPQDGAYDEFCARFPYEETEDQLQSILSVVEDLGKGRPMDRLVCGDVGFGKTEVALRAAFVTAMAGHQVAVIVPTTLLARQHYRGFVERFKGLPVRIRQMSRLVSSKDMQEARDGLASGQVDIVIGTHALLSKKIKFRDLGLMIVDEEQHFGVVHKEQLKQLKSDVHVLTLTATPIPRTLQLALSGVRELSIIATPPVDRLAVRTYVSPFDPVVIREGLLREHYRGGQSFYVCPRVSDLADAEEFLREYVPEVKFITAHGQMTPTEIEDKMTAFYDGQYDVLVSTTIVESGIDIPSANTMVVHRADMFGLAQLYQLRGRVGRSKARAYAYLTVAPNRKLTPSADKRLQVLQSLDSLGAGFTLASHDLDIRGGGNLLGDEQSGQIREVGFELYQEMLEEAVAQMKGDIESEEEGQWSPQINIGTPVLIPESYIADLENRMTLYRRLSQVEDKTELDGLAAEMIDRFGPLPEEVDYLLKIVEIKGLCRLSGVEKVEVGPKGAVVGFRNQTFANPAGLIELVNDERDRAKIRPDQTIFFKRVWAHPEDRLKGTFQLVQQLTKLVQAA